LKQAEHLQTQVSQLTTNTSTNASEVKKIKSVTINYQKNPSFFSFIAKLFYKISKANKMLGLPFQIHSW
jgi:hypothetical protein